MGFVANEQVCAPCPCGSGKKYKFCCLQKDHEERKTEAPRRSRLQKLRDDRDVLVWDHEAYSTPQDEGLALLRAGRAQEAIKCFERAVKAAPFLPHAHNNLALACFYDGQVERALMIVQEVDRKIEPGDVFALASTVHYALVLGLERDAEDALARMEKSRPCATRAMPAGSCPSMTSPGATAPNVHGSTAPSPPVRASLRPQPRVPSIGCASWAWRRMAPWAAGSAC